MHTTPLTSRAKLARTVISDTHALTHMHAQVLRWQARVRVLVALVTGATALVLQRAGVLHGDRVELLSAVALYAGIIALFGVHLRRTDQATPSLVAATILADVMFIFTSTLATAPPEYYDRILILSFGLLHVTEFYFGRRHTVLALVTVVVAYLGVTSVAIADGAHLSWAEELWSISVFASAALVFVVQHRGSQRRLLDIIKLFERAETGDFSRSYDSRADRVPDTVTRVGRAYNRARLHLVSMVLSDPLTGCLNRRGFDQAMLGELTNPDRPDATVALLAVDIDHFKQVNDNYGHVAGDLVLREFGKLLVRIARGGDTVARTGGEEFSILLPHTDATGARAVAERVREALHAHEFLVDGTRIRLTASIGGASGAAQGGEATAARLTHMADQALYAAKRGGRDTTRVWTGTELMATA
jgi:diguanylate cyclase (GGDEF)-like protein